MATMRDFRREPFDASRDFIVVKPLKINGHQYEPTNDFDKTQVNPRRLRLLYDQRTLAMAPLTPKAAVRADPEKMSNRQLALLLEDNGIAIRPISDQTKLRGWMINRARSYLSTLAKV